MTPSPSRDSVSSRVKTDDVMVDMGALWKRYDSDQMRDQDWDLLTLILEDFEAGEDKKLPAEFVDAVATRLYGDDEQ